MNLSNIVLLLTCMKIKFISTFELFFPQWYIQSTCATQGTGLYEGLDWLSNELSNQ